tara:strand:+ start:895 stop:1131 length:237 start_codon:yes stop_codon:yes gene_type:complete
LTDDCSDIAKSIDATATKLCKPTSQSAPLVEKDHSQNAIKSLLANVDRTVDDKIATVKTAHHVDKDRFQSAFLSLMGK